MFNPGAEQQIDLDDGRAFTIGRLEVRHLRAFKEWVAQQEGDPFEVVEKFLGRVPEAESLRQLKEAEQVRDCLKHFSLACPLAQRYLATEEGGARFLRPLLRPAGGKEATEDDALAVYLHMARRGLAEALERAQGEGPAGNAPAPA